MPYVYVSHHGEVQNLKPIQVMTACSLDIYNFPFDVQNCSLTFTSWLHHGERRGRGGGRASVQKAARPSRWPQRTGDASGEGRRPAPPAAAGPAPAPHLSSVPQSATSTSPCGGSPSWSSSTGASS